jgi:cation-transporting P-type ATPase I
LAGEAFSGGNHPGDRAPVVRQGIVLGADLAGAGLAIVGRLAHVRPLPVAVPMVVSMADSAAQLRPVLERRLGQETTDLAVGLSSAGALTLAHRPVGLALETAVRAPRFAEARARRRAFERREAELSRPGAHRVPPIDSAPRPGPMPSGPVERLANPAAAGSTAAYLAALVLGRSHPRAQGFFAAGIPKAARLGRETFASHVGRATANRGAVVLDPQFLRRLDRVHTVVLDAPILLTGRQVLDELVQLDDHTVSTDELHRRAQQLVDLRRPDSEPEGAEGWAVVPVSSVDPRSSGLQRSVREARARSRPGAAVLALTLEGQPQAVITVLAELDPLAEALVAAAGGVGSVYVAGAGSRLHERLPVDGAVPAGPRLRASIEAIQKAGHGVVLVSARGGAAPAAADVAIGLLGRSSTPPWSADVLCGPGLVEAWRLLEAVGVARRVSRRSSKLAITGSAAAVLLSLAGPARGAASRALTAIDIATAIAVADGTWNAVSLSRRPPPLPADRTRWHAMDPDAVLDLLDSSPAGLSEQDATRRLSSEEREEDTNEGGIATAAMRELDNPLTAVLGVGAGVSAAVGSILDAALIGTVLGVNAVIGGAQRFAADRSLRRLSDTTADRFRLRRGDVERDATGDQLVRGDVITLAAGDVVPADCRLLETGGLEVDEASLTGESQLVAKSPPATPSPAVADRSSMLYASTSVAAGNGTAVVVATGAHTESSRASRLRTGEAPPGGVAARLDALGRVIVPASLASGLVLMGGQLLRGRPFGAALGQAVALSVAAVPEGLPFVATVAELAAARRLSQRGALVRNPFTIEALGRVDVLCFDKTGTLTEGRIALRMVSDCSTACQVESGMGALREVVAAAVRAGPAAPEHGELPHPTDRAVQQGGAAAGVAAADDIGEWDRVDEMQFEPARGYHAVLGRCADGRRLSVKGAPEIVLERCTAWRRNGAARPFTASSRGQVEAEVERLARSGYRVLAVAERAVSDRFDLTETRIQDLEFVGLLGLADPVRPTATDAVAQLQQAGVEIVMITGDHPSTAESIAAELDALNGRQVLTGPEVEALDDDALAGVLPDIAVFARVSPVQKARIVAALQQAGRVVAVTGDGANDAAAIRLANVGVALGRGATSAARGAADLVVTDDRIETIADAIVEGRAMWASVRDALSILLGGNLGEIAYTLASGLTASAGLNARQLLLVNLLTDMLPAMAVALRPPPGITAEVLLAEGPETSLGSALTRDIVVRAATTAGAAYAAWLAARLTGGRARADTVGLVALVDAQLLQTMVVGNRSPVVLAAGAVSLGALALIVQTPGLSQFFGSRPLGPGGWAIGLGTAAAATLVSAAIPPVFAAVRRETSS